MKLDSIPHILECAKLRLEVHRANLLHQAYEWSYHASGIESLAAHTPRPEKWKTDAQKFREFATTLKREADLCKSAQESLLAIERSLQ